MPRGKRKSVQEKVAELCKEIASLVAEVSVNAVSSNECAPKKRGPKPGKKRGRKPGSKLEKSTKGPGRPTKSDKPAEDEFAEFADDKTATTEDKNVEESPSVSIEPVVKRKRGRPRKNPLPEETK